MKKIIVLGAGMVGSAMALDLADKHEITSTDLDKKVLDKLKNKNPEIQTSLLDVTNKEELHKTIKPFDLIVCAVPGFLGFQTLKHIIEAGKDVVDISFFPENALELDDLAKQNNVTAIVDCGVAPGMGNIILGYHNEQIKVTDFECLVGGLPKIKKWPFNYKAPFSPIDVIEEYTRPARYVENNKLITRDALSDVEHVDFDKAGTLESFNSDGLRSLIFTMPNIPNMKEKTLRYPGHVEYIRVLKETGFFDSEEIDINGKKISPIDLTNKILFKEWKLKDNEEEITVMKITIKGIDKKGNKTKIIYDLYDEYDPKTQISSMARTTGYTATAAANLLLEGVYDEKGVFPPELVGKHKACYEFVLNYLEERNVVYEKSVV
ncbi:MAG: saccharopine dehydrogenase C-terminal domain-containing protein [Bacteroidota bacterium]